MNKSNYEKLALVISRARLANPVTSELMDSLIQESLKGFVSTVFTIGIDDSLPEPDPDPHYISACGNYGFPVSQYDNYRHSTLDILGWEGFEVMEVKPKGVVETIIVRPKRELVQGRGGRDE